MGSDAMFSTTPPPGDDHVHALLGGPCTDACTWIEGRGTVHVPPSNLAPEPGPAPSKVDHPPHYTGHPSGVECITVAEHMNFNCGNALKYLWRAGSKGGPEQELEDLMKARWYIEREIDRLDRG